MRAAFGGGHSNKFFIGDDRCGNYYFIPDSEESPRVLLLAHDPEGIEDTGQSVGDFMDTENGYLLVQNADGVAAVVARTAVIGESILEPISLVEWQGAINQTLDLRYATVSYGVNLATGEETEYEIQGLAYGRFLDVEIQAKLRYGRVDVWTRTDGKNAWDAALTVAGRLAKQLGANVTVGARKRSSLRRQRWFNVKSRNDI